jgi:hypothetical protein
MGGKLTEKKRRRQEENSHGKNIIQLNRVREDKTINSMSKDINVFFLRGLKSHLSQYTHRISAVTTNLTEK